MPSDKMEMFLRCMLNKQNNGSLSRTLRDKTAQGILNEQPMWNKAYLKNRISYLKARAKNKFNKTKEKRGQEMRRIILRYKNNSGDRMPDTDTSIAGITVVDQLLMMLDAEQIRNTITSDQAKKKDGYKKYSTDVKSTKSNQKRVSNIETNKLKSRRETQYIRYQMEAFREDRKRAEAIIKLQMNRSAQILRRVDALFQYLPGQTIVDPPEEQFEDLFEASASDITLNNMISLSREQEEHDLEDALDDEDELRNQESSNDEADQSEENDGEISESDEMDEDDVDSD